VHLEFDPRVARLSAIKKAAYRLSDIAFVDITIAGHRICCELTPINDDSNIAIEHAFRTAVLDEDLRAQIADQTEPIRTAILALAFAPLTGKTDR
jgi:His-Xaa-Ser system protein HxsD